MSSAQTAPVGPLLREWRTRRRVSQLDLSSETGVSTRHLSFIETGRSRPSREMVLRLAEVLDLPLRDRNALLVAAGFAPAYPQTPLSAESMRDMRRSLQGLINAHMPCPAMAVDHAWNIILANDAALMLADLLPPDLAEEPLNVIRGLLHPRGVRAYIPNFADYSATVMQRLHRQLRATGDAAIRDLIRECESYPGVTTRRDASLPVAPVMQLQLDPSGPVLSFFTVVSTLGTPYDVTLEEIVVESFFPADAETAAAIGMGDA